MYIIITIFFIKTHQHKNENSMKLSIKNKLTKKNPISILYRKLIFIINTNNIFFIKDEHIIENFETSN